MDSENKRIIAACNMLRLCVFALTGRGGESVDTSAASLADIYGMSAYNGLVSLVGEGIDRLGVEKNEENAPVLDAFNQARAMAVRKNILLDTERAVILSHFDEKGIWYMPLKGAILKDMYPKLGLRQMSDNDILFDPAYREYVHDYFVSLGYTVEEYMDGFHDVYQKKPIFSYEMHVELYSEKRPIFREYYKDVKSRLIKDDGNGAGYHFTDEDFYIFLVLHAHKHFVFTESIGAKHLVDVYVYLSKKPCLDFGYIESELDKLGAGEFERGCRTLVGEIFDNIESFDIEKLPEDMRTLLSAFMLNMFNISTEGRIEKGVRSKGRFQYLMSRIFPGVEHMKKYKPIFARWYLLPFGWIYRAFDILFNRLGKSLREIKMISRSSRKKDK